MLIGLLIGVVINEVSYIFLRSTARAPKSIELVIPMGTSERVARGETPPSIPDTMTFVVGDMLVVKNEDAVDHQLGPLWVPPGSSASLALNEVQSYSYSCSFQPGKYFGLDVHEPLTIATRIYGILYAGIPLGVMLAVYSLIVPSKEKKLNDLSKDL